MATQVAEASEATKRACIVLGRWLSPGEAANVSALLMGQLARSAPGLYGSGVAWDSAGLPHAAIRCSTVVLKGGAGQLTKLAGRLKETDWADFCCFSSLGQSLHNQYEEYVERLKQQPVEVVGVALFGDDAAVKALTKSFSLL